MARYFTSDTHYGHRGIVWFCERPYANVHEMDVDLVRRACDLLGAGDDLWHLGDVAMGRLDASLTKLARIPADVTLVAGNHDRCHPYHGGRSARFVEVYRDTCRLAGLVLTNTRLRLGSGAEVQVSHFPFAGTDARPGRGRDGHLVRDKFAPWRPVDDGCWLLCGHVHEKWRQHGRMINVGVDAWAGRPVSEEAICGLIDAGPADLEPLPWS